MLPSWNEIYKEISKPIPADKIATRKQGGRDIDYIHWYDAVELMDQRVPSGWDYEVRSIHPVSTVTSNGEPYGYVIAIVRVSIPCAEGIRYREAQAQEDDTLNAYGDTATNVEAQALKRALAKLGLGLHLYDKGDGERPANYDRYNDGQQQQEGGFPANPIARSLSDLVTTKQLGMIRAISREIGIDADEECTAVMNCKTDELSKRACSSLIQHLQSIQKGEAQPLSKSPQNTSQAVNTRREPLPPIPKAEKSPLERIIGGKQAIEGLGGTPPERPKNMNNEQYIKLLETTFRNLRDGNVTANIATSTAPATSNNGLATKNQIFKLEEEVKKNPAFDEEELCTTISNGECDAFEDLSVGQASELLEQLGIPE